MENKKIRSIVFDFDGVLAESVQVKGQAFYDLYEAHGTEIQNKVLDYHLNNGGVSRYDKIRHYETQLLKTAPSETEIEEIAQRFSVLVEEKVAASPWVLGGREFLTKYSEVLPLYIASATPQEELERIVQKRGMSSYFDGVYGTPIKKAEHLKNIVQKKGWDAQEILMIGDTISDYNAAKEAGTQFLGRLLSEANPFPVSTPFINDLTELSQWISE